MVSSGDESARKEYIHPRATLIGALGKHSRVDEPLIFVTELVAFFETEGNVRPEFHRLADDGVAVIDERGKAVLDKKAKSPSSRSAAPRMVRLRFARTASGCWFTQTVAKPT